MDNLRLLPLRIGVRQHVHPQNNPRMDKQSSRSNNLKTEKGEEMEVETETQMNAQ